MLELAVWIPACAGMTIQGSPCLTALCVVEDWILACRSTSEALGASALRLEERGDDTGR